MQNLWLGVIHLYHSLVTEQAKEEKGGKPTGRIVWQSTEYFAKLYYK